MAARLIEVCSGWLTGRGGASGVEPNRRGRLVEAVQAYGYLAPAFALLLIFTLGPFV